MKVELVNGNRMCPQKVTNCDIFADIIKGSVPCNIEVKEKPVT